MNAIEREAVLAAKKQSTTRFARLWCKSDWREFPIFRVPIEALLLNPDNRRFKAEKKLMEERLGRSLDPENNPTDELSVISILLDSNLDIDVDRVVGKPQKSTEALRLDWLNRKQESPFWIRPDGTVRNGNRRLAVIKRLTDAQGGDWSWVDAIILEPNDIDEQDLFEMEQREQLTENLKVRYTDINLLLTLREAALLKGIDWNDAESLERVAGELQMIVGGAGDKAYAATQLRAIKYMDDYLIENNAAGQYQKLIGKVERFRDVGKMMGAVESEYSEDATDVLRMAFAAIKANRSHGIIRQLRKMYLQDRDRFYQLLARIDEEETRTEPESGLPEPDLSSTAELEEDDEPEPDIGPADDAIARLIDDTVSGFAAANSLNIASLVFQAEDLLMTVVKRESQFKTALAGTEGREMKEKLESIGKILEALLRP